MNITKPIKFQFFIYIPIAILIIFYYFSSQTSPRHTILRHYHTIPHNTTLHHTTQYSIPYQRYFDRNTSMIRHMNYGFCCCIDVTSWEWQIKHCDVPLPFYDPYIFRALPKSRNYQQTQVWCWSSRHKARVCSGWWRWKVEWWAAWVHIGYVITEHMEVWTEIGYCMVYRGMDMVVCCMLCGKQLR